jgi:hypothetical protein
MRVIIQQMAASDSNPPLRDKLFRAPDLSSDEVEVVARIDELRATLRYEVVQTPRRWTGSLRRVMFARAILGSNTIEGYNVTLADAMAVAEGEELLDAAEETGERSRAIERRDPCCSSPVTTLQYSELLNSSFMTLNHDMTKGPGLLRTGPVFVNTNRPDRVRGSNTDHVPD